MTNRFKMTRVLFSGGAAMQALALLGAGVGMVALAAPAAAQDYTTGAVSGSLTDPDGKPIANATVTLRSESQGQVRTLTTSNSGAFSAVGLTPGTYAVTATASGFRDYAATINVVAAQENSVGLTLVSVNAPADIVVTGSRVRQDFTKTTQGLNLDVPALVKDVPVPRSVTGLILLAPTTNPGATAFGNVASIGGSSVAENAYYINGLNITNPDTYVGSTRVPFDFYQTVDVQTSGYAAEFGRAAGGVINATTKSGSNTPFMALHGNFQPVFAQATGKPTGLLPGSPTSLPQFTQNESEQFTIEGGGALIKDHLFVYGLFEPQVVNYNFAVPTSGYYEKDKSTSPFYGGKVDAYITSTQHLEFTFFDTENLTYIDRFKFTPNATVTSGTIGALTGSEQNKTGGFNFVARYTGSITDWFQISGAYGINKDANDTTPSDTSSYFVNDRRTATVGGVSSTISGQKFQTSAIADTKRKFYRVDGDLRFALFGQHHVRFGIDNEDLSETKLTFINGGIPVSYSYRNSFVLLTYERLGGAISANDRAYYLQDSWEPTAGLTINAGVRDDTFKQYNLEGQKYLDFQNNFAARLGFSYVPGGSSKFRFTGSYGRYFIPPAMNLGFRGHDDYFQEAFSYGAYTAANFPVDPNTGLPLANLGPALTTLGANGFTKACPSDLSAAPGRPINGAATCSVFGNNTQDPAYAKVAPGTKPTSEDEFTLSAHYQATQRLSFGVSGVYRRLRNISEDTDFYSYLAAYYKCDTAQQTGTAAQCNRYDQGNTYYIWNPGKSSLTVVDWVDPTKQVTLTGLQFPKAKRFYEAVTLEVNRADDGFWGIHASATLSRSKGNYEGTVKSDAGNGAQSDAGSTQDFDYLGLTENSYGLLPNDHALTVKSYGFIRPFHALTMGYGLQVQSPMHGSCEGLSPDDADAAGYGPSSFFCGTNLQNGVYTSSVATPRGTAFKTDWYTQVDLSLRYNVPGTNLVLRADVFNILNSQAVIQRYNQHETTGSQPDPLYLTPLYYQAPRYARFGFDWSF